MGKALGLPVLLATLGVVGYLFVQQLHSSGPASPAVTQVVTRADVVAAGAEFAAAGQALQAWYSEYGTYAGATLPPGSGVALVRADVHSYCLQTDTGASQEHMVGPDGQTLPGPC